MWHVSVVGFEPARARYVAQLELAGVGNARKEWVEVKPAVVHLRRLLTEAEQKRIGEPADIRDTIEAWARFEAVLRVVSALGRSTVFKCGPV